jgi:hypothetical protein
VTTSQRDEYNVPGEKHLEKKTIIETGKKCTVSGEWETQGSISTIVYVSKGELMPLYCGKKVKWTLLRNG